ncbi:MAG: hypothetical protein ACOX5R_04755 [bacterium]
MTRVIENNGIGALYGTFEINQTGENYDLSAEDVGCAVALAGNNKVNKGLDGARLLGRLEHACGRLATVQIAGVVRLELNSGKGMPQVGDAVVIDGAGKVYQAPALISYDPAGGTLARGTILAIDSTNHLCDILI